MGWVEVRPKGRPRACWREAGTVRRQACDTAEACEERLKIVEQCQYVPAAERRPGRHPRGHRPSYVHYMNHGCRQAGCATAFKAYRAAEKERARQRMIDDPGSFAHPSQYALNAGCRCDHCAALQTDLARRNNERKKATRHERGLYRVDPAVRSERARAGWARRRALE